MSNRSIIFQVLAFALFIGVQVTIFRNLALFNISFCFIYLGFILLLPIDIDRILLIFLGFVSGLIVDTESGVRAYKGIPFAAPPVGDLRWKPPQPVVPWDGVRDLGLLTSLKDSVAVGVY